MRSMSAVLRWTWPISTPASMDRGLRSLGTTPGTALTQCSVVISFVGRSDELPAVLPRPAVLDLKHDDQEAHALQRAGHDQRTRVDGTEADRLDELEHLVLGRLVVACHEAVEASAADYRFGHPRRKGVVEGFYHAHFGVTLLDFFCVGEAAEHLARILNVDVVGGIHDDLAVDCGPQTAEHFAELVVWHGNDHEVGVRDRLLIGVGGMRAGRLGSFGSLLRAGGRHGDFVAGLHARLRERLADVPRADNRNFHEFTSLSERYVALGLFASSLGACFTRRT